MAFGLDYFRTVNDLIQEDRRHHHRQHNPGDLAAPSLPSISKGSDQMNSDGRTQCRDGLPHLARNGTDSSSPCSMMPTRRYGAHMVSAVRQEALEVDQNFRQTAEFRQTTAKRSHSAANLHDLAPDHHHGQSTARKHHGQGLARVTSLPSLPAATPTVSSLPSLPPAAHVVPGRPERDHQHQHQSQQWKFDRGTTSIRNSQQLPSPMHHRPTSQILQQARNDSLSNHDVFHQTRDRFLADRVLGKLPTVLEPLVEQPAPAKAAAMMETVPQPMPVIPPVMETVPQPLSVIQPVQEGLSLYPSSNPGSVFTSPHGGPANNVTGLDVHLQEQAYANPACIRGGFGLSPQHRDGQDLGSITRESSPMRTPASGVGPPPPALLTEKEQFSCHAVDGSQQLQYNHEVTRTVDRSMNGHPSSSPLIGSVNPSLSPDIGHVAASPVVDHKPAVAVCSPVPNTPPRRKVLKLMRESESLSALPSLSMASLNFENRNEDVAETLAHHQQVQPSPEPKPIYGIEHIQTNSACIRGGQQVSSPIPRRAVDGQCTSMNIPCLPELANLGDS